MFNGIKSFLFWHNKLKNTRNTKQVLYFKNNKMKNTILNHQSLNKDLATLLFRLIFGGMFVYYGYTKLASFNEILPMFGDIIGIGAKLSFSLVIFAELFCGFLVLVGCFTRLAIIPIFIAMAVAFFVAHAKDPFIVKQLAFLYLLLSIVIFVAGSGKFSIDRLIRNKKIIRNTSSQGSIIAITTCCVALFCGNAYFGLF